MLEKKGRREKRGSGEGGRGKGVMLEKKGRKRNAWMCHLQF